MDAKAKELALYIAVIILAAIAIAEIVHFTEPAQYSLSVSMQAYPTMHLYAYNTTFFNITVKNTGSSISGMVVGLYENGTAIKTYKVSIPHGDSVSIDANYTFTASGTYTFKAIADPSQLFNIADRASTVSSTTINVSQSASPDIYASMPNNNIKSTSSFTFSSQGLRSISMLSSIYNASFFTDAFGPAAKVLPSLFISLYGYVAYANSAAVVYDNKSTAYALWLKGTIEPGTIDSLLSTFNFKHSSIIRNSTQISYWKMSNTTSICVLYQSGWTKIVSYYNASISNATCASIAGYSYASNESAQLVSALRQNKNLSAYQSKLIYVNSTNTGSALFYNSSTLGAMNLFQNNYGLFAGMIMHNYTVGQNTCYGLLYSSNSINVCSVYMIPASGKALAQYGMINSTEATHNYTAMLYSLTNQSLLMAAHESAVELIGSLGLPKSMSWVSIFKNTCSLSNSSMLCSVNSFNYSTSTASISIKNLLSNPVSLNSISCYMSGSAAQTSKLNISISHNSTSSISTYCSSLSLPVISTGENYVLALNYTYMNKTGAVLGSLNITNYGFS